MPDSQSLVSVVIPTYNRAHYLPECLAGVLGQTHSRLEVLVVDDGSTDGTQPLMEKQSRRDSRIKYIHQENGGVSAARNTGLRAAQGDYIALLDSDDVWHPWKLRAQLAAFRELPPEVGMVWSDMTAIGPQGTVLHHRFLKKMYGAYQLLQGRQIFADTTTLDVPDLGPTERDCKLSWGNLHSWMLYGNLVHTPTTLLRRSRANQVGLFDEALRCGEDYVYHLTTCRLGPVAFLDAPTILYRIGCDDQITAPRNQTPFARAFLATIQREFREHADLIELTPAEQSLILADAHVWLGTALRAGGHPLSATSQFVQALCQQVENRQAWKELVRTFLPAAVQNCLRKCRVQPSPAVPPGSEEATQKNVAISA